MGPLVYEVYELYERIHTSTWTVRDTNGPKQLLVGSEVDWFIDDQFGLVRTSCLLGVSLWPTTKIVVLPLSTVRIIRMLANNSHVRYFVRRIVVHTVTLLTIDRLKRFTQPVIRSGYSINMGNMTSR